MRPTTLYWNAWFENGSDEIAFKPLKVVDTKGDYSLVVDLAAILYKAAEGFVFSKTARRDLQEYLLNTPNSPWCKGLNFDTANGVGGFVDSVSISRGISRFDLCIADSDLLGVPAGSRPAKEAGPRGCSIPAACPPPSACAGSNSG